MVIIIEGVDKVGKSTVIKELEKKLNAIVFKLSKTNKPETERDAGKVKILYTELFKQAERLSRHNTIIFDRAYPSEIVYSIKRGYDALKDKFWVIFDNRVAIHKKWVLIYCHADKKTIIKRMKQEREDYMTEKDIDVLKNRYQRFLKRTKLNIIRVNTRCPIEKNIKLILKFLQR